MRKRRVIWQLVVAGIILPWVLGGEARLFAAGAGQISADLENAGGEAGAALKVARLLAMPSSTEDPRGTMSASRLQLAREIGAMGDVAIKPLQEGLAKVHTDDQRRDIAWAMGAVSTVAGTRALIGWSTQADAVIRRQAMSALTDRLGVGAEKGGSDEILPALAKLMPAEKDEGARISVCARVVRIRTAIPPADKPDDRLLKQAVDMLRERLKNDGSAQVRMWAAVSLTELGDNSGLAELKAAVLAMQSGEGEVYRMAGLAFPLERLVPALERATGQKFGPVPLNPELSSSSTAGPGLAAEREALLDTVAAWIKANPVLPASTTTFPADAGKQK